MPGSVVDIDSARGQRLSENAAENAWVEAGAPTPMQIWRQLQADGRAPTAEVLPQWLTTEQVAQMVSKAPKTIRRAIRDGRLTASGGPPYPYRVARADAVEFAKASIAPRRRAPSPQRRGRKAPGTTFRDLARKAKP